MITAFCYVHWKRRSRIRTRVRTGTTITGRTAKSTKRKRDWRTKDLKAGIGRKMTWRIAKNDKEGKGESEEEQDQEQMEKWGYQQHKKERNRNRKKTIKRKTETIWRKGSRKNKNNKEWLEQRETTKKTKRSKDLARSGRGTKLADRERNEVRKQERKHVETGKGRKSTQSDEKKWKTTKTKK